MKIFNNFFTFLIITYLSLNHIGAEDSKNPFIINQIFVAELRQVDNIVQVAQHIGQLTNKGAIKLDQIKKQELKNWLNKLHEVSSEIQELSQEDITEDIIKISYVTLKQLVHVINIALDTKFKILLIPDSPKNEGLEKISIGYVEEMLSKQENKLYELQNKADLLGLSAINLIVRKIEDLNSQYKITSKLYPAAIISGLAALGYHYFYKPQNALPNPAPSNGIVNAIIASTIVVNTMKIIDPESMFRGILKHYAQKKTEDHLGDWASGSFDFVKRQIKNGYNVLRGTPKSEKVNGFEYYEDLTLDDKLLVGLESQKEILYDIVRYMENPEVYERSNTSVRKSYLLVGPSGCGKTHAARALAGTINQMLESKGLRNKVGFKSVKYSELNWQPESISKMIKEAKKDAPCILFIDELHLYGVQTDHWNSQVLNAFLTGMDGLDNVDNVKYPVIIIAATNRADLIDPALLRRFGTPITFEKPNTQAIKNFFEVKLEEFAISLKQIDTAELARITAGCSFAQLEDIIKHARFKARTNARGVTSTQEIIDSINSIIFNVKEEENLPISEKQKDIIAAHQSGHALMYWLLDQPTKLFQVTLKGAFPRIKEDTRWSKESKENAIKTKKTKYGNIFLYPKDRLINTQIDSDKSDECKILLAGKIAEELLLKIKSGYHKKDKQKALALIKEIVLNEIPQDFMPETKQNEYKTQVLEMLIAFEKEVRELLSQNIGVLEKLVKSLKEKTTLYSKDIEEIIGGN